MTPLAQMFQRLKTRHGQSRAARTVEIYGWVLLAEGALVLLAPQRVASLLHFGPLVFESARFFQITGLLVTGVGFLYTVSGRVNAEGFVFATLLDRPLVPVAVALLWYLGIVPGWFGLLFALQDLGTFLWTFSTWRADVRRS